MTEIVAAFIIACSSIYSTPGQVSSCIKSVSKCLFKNNPPGQDPALMAEICAKEVKFK